MALVISMIAFSEQPSLDARKIKSDLTIRWPNLPQFGDADKKDNTLAFSIGSTDVILGLMPGPIPWSDLEGPCSTSYLWPKATEALKHHKAHVIVTVNGDLDPLALSSLLTKVTASVMSTSPVAIGVYWGNATLVIPKDMFIDFAVEIMPHGPPLHIWVDFRVGLEDKKSSSGFTTGMAALGHMEFEAQRTPERPGDLRERLLALAGYVLENGPVIKDGDTVGEDASEKIRVTYSDSVFGHKGKIMRLEYEQPPSRKSWWKLK